ncbi:MAG TPA: TetR family transcriptional regulator [Acidimicrobiales bacterium]|nr:TetR family transcriptional regulator [Acidimicrobiales bacterium]
MSLAGAVTVTAEDSRRRLTPRQVAVVERLVEAAAAEARQSGYESTTVRAAARRAGVAPATAYTYFASKDHLLAEVLWRRMEALPPAEPSPGATPLERVSAELRALGLFMADDPLLAAACTTALLGPGPEFRAVRLRFGAEVHARLSRALGEAHDAAVLQGLDLAYSGAMLWAGMGHLAFAEVPAVLSELAARLIGAVP